MHHNSSPRRYLTWALNLALALLIFWLLDEVWDFEHFHWDADWDETVSAVVLVLLALWVRRALLRSRRVAAWLAAFASAPSAPAWEPDAPSAAEPPSAVSLAEHPDEVVLELDLLRDTLAHSPLCSALAVPLPTENVSQSLPGLLHPDDVPAAEALLAQCRQDGRRRSLELRVRDGQGQYLRCLLKLGGVRDADGRILRLIGTVTDCRRESRELARLRRLAETDGLTGLLNRRAFQRQAQEALDQGADAALLFMVDMDRFKEINDTYGHQAGDDALRLAAQALRDFAGQSGGIAGRLGGDEFAVFLPRPTPGQAAALLAQLEAALRFRPSPDAHVCAATVGMAAAQAGEGYAALYRRADEDLYRRRAQRREAAAASAP